MPLGQALWNASEGYYESLTLADDGISAEQAFANRAELVSAFKNYAPFWRRHVYPATTRPNDNAFRPQAAAVRVASRRWPHPRLRSRRRADLAIRELVTSHRSLEQEETVVDLKIDRVCAFLLLQALSGGMHRCCLISRRWPMPDRARALIPPHVAVSRSEPRGSPNAYHFLTRQPENRLQHGALQRTHLPGRRIRDKAHQVDDSSRLQMRGDRRGRLLSR